ncbi:MAG: YfbK domain-containing protein [Acidimicrobiales bacterium]
MKSRITYLAALLALAMLAGACGSSDFSDAETSSSEADGLQPAESGGAESADDETTNEGQTIAADEAMGEDSVAQSAGEPADASGAARASTTTAPQGEPAADAASDGGFFAAAPEEESDAESEANTFQDYGVRPFVSTGVDPLSTFALDVDTASYSIGRQWLNSGAVPPPESVRVEEYLNSFDYDYVAPRDGLNVQADGGPSPYDPDNVIVRIGVQAEQVANADRPSASLTFVVDTSGSMDRADRLELVKTSLRRLTQELESRDTVSIITYSDNAQILLAPTSVADEEQILAAIDRLRPTGSTNLEAGLQAGYDMANEAFQLGGINRVVLASDGVANVGLTDPDGLARLIREDADRGIHLVTVGVGMGNFNDVVMEQSADQGDGFYAYVNDEREAEKLFSDDLVSTLLTVAIDGKIQVEFNEDAVDEYRLIGFENRAVLDDDFRNDAVDAGELGAGHQVTALYELKVRRGYEDADVIGTVQLRWEDPEERSVRETRLVLTPGMIDDRWNDTDEDFRLAVTVAAFAEVLRDSPHTGDVSLVQVGQEADALSPGSGSIQELADMIWNSDALL